MKINLTQIKLRMYLRFGNFHADNIWRLEDGAGAQATNHSCCGKHYIVRWANYGEKTANQQQNQAQIEYLLSSQAVWKRKRLD